MAARIITEEKIKHSLVTLAVLVALSFVFLVSTAFYVARSLRAVEATTADSASRTRAALTVQDILRQMESGFRVLRTISIFLDTANVIDPRETPVDYFVPVESVQAMQRLAYAMRRLDISSDFHSITWYAPSGEGARLYIEGNSARRIWLSDDNAIAQEAVTKAFGGEAAISPFYFDQAIQRRVFIQAMPVYVEGAVVGVITSTSTTDAIQRALENAAKANPQYSYFLVDETSSYLAAVPSNGFPEIIHYRQGEETVLLPVFPPETRYQIQSRQNGFVSARQNNTTYYGYIQSLDNIEGANMRVICINTESNSSSVTNSQIHIARRLFIVFCGFVILAMILGTWLTCAYAFRLIHYLFFDRLTGADNANRFRRKLASRLENAGVAARDDHAAVVSGVGQAAPSPQESRAVDVGDYATLAALNVRQFRSINEIFGFENASQLLVIIKQILDRNIKKDEFFCRESADLFYIYLRESDRDAIILRLRAIMDETAQEYLETRDYHLKMYAGILPLDPRSIAGFSAGEIFLRLSLALSIAKADPTETFCFYNEKLYAQEETQNYIETHMNQALAEGEFKLYLQPKIDLASGTIGGAEALVRWEANSGRMIYPDQFIPLFNSNGFCVKLDMYMLEQACALMRGWIDSGLEPVPLSVNQSRLLFFEARYVENVSAIAEKYSIPPGLLTLEVLEEMYLEKTDEVNTKIAELRRRGFLISMDDFGSGYSSFSAIGDLSVDELKLDRKFLMEAASAENWRMKIVIDQIVRMARRLHLSVVAEGVETKEDEQLIRGLGCDYGQGYYYCKPIPVSEFNERYMHDQQEGLGDDDEPFF